MFSLKNMAVDHVSETQELAKASDCVVFYALKPKGIRIILERFAVNPFSADEAPTYE